MRRLRWAVWKVGSHHDISLINLDALALDELEISQAGDDLVSDGELDAHAVFGSLLDGEWLLLEFVDGSGLAEIQDNVLTAWDFEGELQNVGLKRGQSQRSSSSNDCFCPKARVLLTLAGSAVPTASAVMPREAFHLLRDSSLASAHNPSAYSTKSDNQV